MTKGLGADGARGSRTTKGLGYRWYRGSRTTRGLGSRWCPRLPHNEGPRLPMVADGVRGSHTSKHQGADGGRGSRTTKGLGADSPEALARPKAYVPIVSRLPHNQGPRCRWCSRLPYDQGPRLPMVPRKPHNQGPRLSVVTEAPALPRYQGVDGARGFCTTKGLVGRWCPRLPHIQAPRCARGSRTIKAQVTDGTRGSRTTRGLGYRWYPRLPHDQGPRLPIVSEAPAHRITKVPMVAEDPARLRA
ncbi:hypothetical protein PVK06_026609 [Gossypium arboreum]|uniref:Uncharacterized protein n=1 Tax=Gossypium arboreum TaxID=29729 RepID=A0ABR0NY38_GOSAR|nr:hypothetical protein PVK06_026609 [Gossypium arboreum]